MRFVIDALRDASGERVKWHLTVLQNGAELGKKQIELTGIDGDPAASLLPVSAGEGAARRAELLDGAAVYENIMLRSASADEVRRFGKYLFDTLLGSALWQRMLTRAGEQCMELSLRWSQEDWELARLPWEAMHDGTEFLASSANKLPVAISRRVSLAGDEVPPLFLQREAAERRT